VSAPGLALLFTPGVTVSHWERAGFLDREVRYYRALARRVGVVTFVSEGRADDGLRARLSPIELLDGARPLPRPVARAVAGRAAARRARIVKTNQLANVAGALAAKAAGAHLVARGGYVGSEPWRHRSRFGPHRSRETVTELLLTHAAERVIVTTDEAASYLRERYNLARERVHVVPNFAEIDRFDLPSDPEDGLVTMVGRLTTEKDVGLAVDALTGLRGVRLRVVGDGPLRADIADRARSRGVLLELIGVVPHERLPELLARTEIYLITSRYEGHPKALIEAMASGVPCVGTSAPGIRSVIEHERTGLLASSPTSGAIREAIARLRADPLLRQRLGRAAREHVRQYALDRVVALECDVYREAGWLVD